MATKNFAIENYAVQLTDSIDLGGGVIAHGTRSVRVRGIIACKGGDHLFFLLFLAPGSSVPEPSYSPTDKLGVVYLPFSDIGPYVDFLRNEQPLYAYLDSDQPQRNSISSDLEPVGEGEPRPSPLMARLAGLTTPRR